MTHLGCQPPCGSSETWTTLYGRVTQISTPVGPMFLYARTEGHGLSDRPGAGLPQLCQETLSSLALLHLPMQEVTCTAAPERTFAGQYGFLLPTAARSHPSKGHGSQRHDDPSGASSWKMHCTFCVMKNLVRITF